MTELITAIVPYISPAAFPTVVVVLGLFYIYRKIGNERQITKTQRDNDSLQIHDQLLKHDFEIANLKGQSIHHEQILDDLRQQVTILNQNLSVVVTKLDTLAEAIKELKK